MSPGRVDRRLGATALGCVLVIGLLLGFMTLSIRPVRGADVTLRLYGTFVGGWSTTPGGETNPGPTITVNLGDHLTVTLTSEDAAEHGLFIDYNNNSRIDFGTDYSGPTTTSTITFSLDATVAGSFWYFCSIHSGPPYSWDSSTMRGRWIVVAPPTITFHSPGMGVSWTGGSTHDIVFDLTSDVPPSGLDVWVNYSYNGGSSRGTIAGPVPGGTNPNVVAWTTPRIDATNAVINVTAHDSRGLTGYANSPPVSVDSTPPAVASMTPASGATGVSLNSKIIVAWTEPMNASATGSAASFGVRRVSDGAWISGTMGWSSGSSVMTFTSAAALDPSTTYEVHVNASAKDQSDPGNPLANPVVWQFTTGTTADTTPPTISAVQARVFPSAMGGFANITAEVADDVAVGEVSVHIMGPSLDVNVTMVHGAGNTWYSNRSYDRAGTYSFTIRASDSSGNVAFTLGGSFTVGGSNAPPPNQLGVVVGIAVVAVAVALVWFAFRARRRGPPKPPPHRI